MHGPSGGSAGVGSSAQHGAAGRSAPAGGQVIATPSLAVVPPVALRDHLRFPDAPIIARPHDRPVIYKVEIAPTSVGAGDVVVGSVTTTTNVASVVATVAGISAGLPRLGVGRFALVYKLPPIIPPGFRGTYAVTVIARNVDGAEASRTVEMTLH